MPNINVSWS